MLPARIIRQSGKKDEGKRSPAHRAWVRSHKCCVPGCDEMPIECAHVRRAFNSGTGMKPSDAYCVSLCKSHHAASHRGERSFEMKWGIDLLKLAREFYERSPHRRKLDNPYV